MFELSVSPVRSYILTICDGRVVVRSQSRVNALLDIWGKNLPEDYKNILADVTFDGSGADEEIIWSTDLFSKAPKRLTELTGVEAQRYRNLLQDILSAYAIAISKAEVEVKKLLYDAITYPSESSVFCGEGRIVLTDWGVRPADDSDVLGMPYGIEVEDAPPASDTNAVEGNDIPKIGITDNGDKIDEKEEIKTNIPSEEKPKKKLKPLFWILPILILLGLLVAFVINGCSTPMKTVVDVTPEIDSTDISLTEDSVNYIVSNRLVLMLTAADANLEDFVADFRKDYPDEKKYILSSPDQTLKRLTLTLPQNERSTMEETLPAKYSKYGLIVIPDAMYKTSSTKTNDPALSDTEMSWYFEECGIYDAWDVTMGDDDIVVAIIDDGFDLDHPELQGRAYRPYNAVTHSSVITPSPGGHGTHVASTAIGNANNSEGTAGVAPNCKFMPIQVGDANGQMASSAIFDAVIYAINNGADVVNMSLGMSFGPYVQYMPPHMQYNIRNFYFKQEEQVWNSIFNLARENNVTFVLAGGNENILIGIDPMSRSNNTIRVSATQPDKNKASFSNYGDCSTVSAPGVHIYNAIPGGDYTYMDGTSMAAPIVTGGCALLKSHDSSLDVIGLAHTLRQTGKASPSNVGPIVNFAKALGNNQQSPAIPPVAELDPPTDNNPGNAQDQDTLQIPVNVKPIDLIGRWKSTTQLKNQKNETVAIYLSFNGTTAGKLDIIEPSGYCFSAPLTLSIKNDIVYVEQTRPASSPNGDEGYNPYSFIIKPCQGRQASGRAKNKLEAGNVFDFNLIRI